MQCLTQAWHRHEAELRGWLRSRLRDPADADDVLQDVFEKAMLQGKRFCSIENARAWLFRVARNTVIDRYKLSREHLELPDDLPADEQAADAVDNLSECIPRILSEMDASDREIITLCDLDGMSQQQYAEMKGIRLPTAKSRLQRARRRMRKQIEMACQVRRDDTGRVCCFVPRPPLK